MTSLRTTSISLALLAMSLSACSSMSRQERNTVGGAAIGGLAGAVLTGGSTLGTVGGAAVGGVIGHEIDKPKDKK